MRAEDVRTIGVVGAGTMGQQIALLGALHGFTVGVHDAIGEALKKAEAWAHTYLDGRVDKGRLARAEADAALCRLTFASDLAGAVGQADLVIEAIVEKLEAKRDLFAQLDRLTPPHALLATNSSTIVSSRLMDVTSRPEKVLNLHFFNPPLVMELVEVCRNAKTTDETVAVAMGTCRRLGKSPILLKREIFGFVVNRLLWAVGNEAMSLVEQGIATPEEIDTAMVKGARYPIGPFALMDMNGIDVGYLVRMERYRESGNEADRPPRIMVEKYEKGEWGRKTGKGWYDHSTQGAEGRKP
ncbi:MAG: 3-hydroxyacyl-CoA dehydrogenase family protein [Deltaproteobacteria bacterium]|nr:3-hydroxyacyl-CoA dehydrogenase family protein [Deltaproteobacteria bacterium]